MPENQIGNQPDTKGLFASKTFWGMIVLLFVTISNKWLDLDIGSETHEVLSEEVLAIVGSVLVIWGRIAASKRIDGV